MSTTATSLIHADPTTSIPSPRAMIYNGSAAAGMPPLPPMPFSPSAATSGIPPPAPPKVSPSSSSNATASSSNTTTAGPIKIGFYEVEHTIGKGNHAIVKLARHRITKTEVAIKIINKHRLDPENLKKVYREIAVLKKIRHPHIIKLYQVMESNNMIYLVTEYAKRGELFDFIAKQKKLSEKEAREKFWQIISAVDYLHKMQITHRDLKAENLLLDANYDIKLADFGFSNYYQKDNKLETYCGSPPWAAPEIFEGIPYTGPEIDVWSLGVVLYALVCGVLPFEGANLQQLRDRVLSGRIRIPYFLSTECENLIRKMLTLDPAKRPTIEQIKRHKWMRREEMEPRLRSLNAFSSSSTDNTHEPHPQILRIMQTLQCEPARVKASVAGDAYDNFHGIYLLLLERLRASNAANISVAINHRGGGGGGAGVGSIATSGAGGGASSIASSSAAAASGANSAASASAAAAPILPAKMGSAMAATVPPTAATPQPLAQNVVAAAACAAAAMPAAEPKARRRQSDAPRPRPPLNALRDHSTFQTTDCIIVTNPTIGGGAHVLPSLHAQHSQTTTATSGITEYEENCSTLSRQSTLDTFGSIDEGVESDTNGCSSDVEANGSGNSLLVVVNNNSPFETFDSRLESDIMSSLNSCPSKSHEEEGHGISSEAASITRRIIVGNGGAGPTCGDTNHQANAPTHLMPTTLTISNENSPCASPQPKSNFGEGWCVSDDSLSTAAAFPTGQLGTKTKAVPELNRPSTEFPGTQPMMRANPATTTIQPGATKPFLPNTNHQATTTNAGVVPKRISLPENLEFQPQVLLNLKQSIHVEKQLGDGAPVDTSKQVLKVRLQQQQQKRQIKARMQLFRQQSYQLAQRQSVIPSNLMNLRIQEDPPSTTPLSPIEDLKSEEVMDTS